MKTRFSYLKQGKKKAMRLNINFKILLSLRLIIICTFLLVTFYLLIVYFNPENNSWLNGKDFSWLNLFRFWLLDQFFSECFTVYIIFKLLTIYARICRLTVLEVSVSSAIKYFIKFLPLALTAFFIYNPVTQSFRFLINHYSDLNINRYYDEYLFNLKLYFIYLPVNLIIIYGALGYLIIYHLKPKENNYLKHIEALTITGETWIRIDEIIWFEKIQYKYLLFTEKGDFQIRKTLTQLENQLDPELFIRINRHTIINLKWLDNYAYWESDKYLLSLKTGKQFTVNRPRLNKIKQQLLNI